MKSNISFSPLIGIIRDIRRGLSPAFTSSKTFSCLILLLCAVYVLVHRVFHVFSAADAHIILHSIASFKKPPWQGQFHPKIVEINSPPKNLATNPRILRNQN